MLPMCHAMSHQKTVHFLQAATQALKGHDHAR
jgi:hypothetical protein